MPRIEIEHQRDFTGGLNLKADPYNLADNESADLLNVDIDRRGGFGVRRGVTPWLEYPIPFTSTADHFTSMFTYTIQHGPTFLVVARSSETFVSDGGDWTKIRDYLAGSARTSFAVMNGVLYFCDAAGAGTYKWSGSGQATQLQAPGFVDDLGSPVGGRFPQSRTICAWHNVMWSGWDQRVRWSHPGRPEDWRTNDWIDVDEDGATGYITALVPFGDQLLVFKQNGLFAIQGYPPDAFSMQPLSMKLGTPEPQSVVVADDAVYFWDVRTGLWKYDGRKLEWVFERISPLIDEGKLTNLRWTTVAEHDRRIYVRVQMEENGSDPNILLIFDPDVGRNGCWTIHDVPTWALWSHRPGVNADDVLLAVIDEQYGVHQLDTPNKYEDEIQPGVTQPIQAHYTTRWFSGRTLYQQGVRKRWKRPVLVAGGAEDAARFLVDVFTDYDATRVDKTFQVTTDIGFLGGYWDGGNWDEISWSGEVDGERSEIVRGSNLGNGMAKALRIKSGTTDEFKGRYWRIHQISMKWIDKRMRA